jgi:hypothetical protein
MPDPDLAGVRSNGVLLAASPLKRPPCPCRCEHWTNAKHTTVGINSESTYDWQSGHWTVPINMTVAHLYRFGGQPVQLTGGVRVYAVSPHQGPDWGLCFVATFLFPKK